MLRALSLSTFLLGISTVLNYATFVVFARTGGVVVFSQYLYDITLAAVFSIVVNYGSQRVFTRDVIETGSEQLSFNVVMSVRAIIGGVSILGLVVWGYWGSAGTPLAAVFLVYHVFQLNFLFEYNATNVQLAFITLIEKITFSITAIAWTLNVGFTWHIYALFLASSMLALVLQFTQNSALLVGFRFSPTAEMCRYCKKYISLVLVDLVQLTYGNFSRLIIQQKNGLLDFGAASIGFQIVKIASIFQTQVEYVFRPQTVRLSAARDSGGLKRHAVKYVSMTTLPTIAGSATLFLFAKPLIEVGFGSEYAAAIPALEIISFLPISINLMRFVEMIFVGLGRFQVNLALSFSTSLLLLGGLMLVPTGTSITVFLWLVLAMQAVYVVLLSIVAAIDLTSR